MVIDMRLGQILVTPPKFDVEGAWNFLVKRVIGRFVRGNIAAQRHRIVLPKEQADRHRVAGEIAAKWRNRRTR